MSAAGKDMGNTIVNPTVGANATMSRDRKRVYEKFGIAYSLAIEMAIAVIVPILIGRWLDGRTGKGPWFTIGGLILGGAAAMRSAYRALIELQKRNGGDQSRKEDREN
jgi:F0F1-type ATP synthase assembly protein I